MGVTGLWRLIDPAGKPVPIETLENKVLAVDISIWLHQMVKGFQDARGAPVPNAHLLGLFQRLCKLLYYRIKPVFVFDGAFPDLKKETIARRQDSKAKMNSESERLKREIMLLLGKRTAIGSLLGKVPSPKKNRDSDRSGNDDLFKLPALPESQDEGVSEEESESDSESEGPHVDLQAIDIESQTFKQLPAKERYYLLSDIKETRKLNSWGRLHELPKDSDRFSDFQMQRLIKRRKVQEVLDETGKEMEGNYLSINELELLLNDEGIDTKFENLPSRRIASSDTTRFLLIKDLKQAREDAIRLEKEKEIAAVSENNDTEAGINEKKNELGRDLEIALKMSLKNRSVKVKGGKQNSLHEVKTDVCKETSESKPDQTAPNSNRIDIQKPSTSANADSEDEELNLAIQMSLECAQSTDSNEKKGETTDQDTTHIQTTGNKPSKESAEDTAKINDIETNLLESGEEELNNDMQKAIEKSLQKANSDQANTNIESSSSNTSFLVGSDYSSDSEDSSDEVEKLNAARAFMMQNSDFTNDAIKKLITSKSRAKKQNTKSRINEILAELDKVPLDNSVVEVPMEKKSQTLVLSSDEDDDSDCGKEPRVKKLPTETVVLDTTVEESPVSTKSDLEQNKCIEVDLDSSDLEEVPDKTIETNPTNNKTVQTFPLNTDTESDAEDFEEVSEPKIPVVEVTLNLNTPIEDDIFADVFKQPSNVNQISTEIKSEAQEQDKELSETDDKKSVVALSDNENKAGTNKPMLNNKIGKSKSQNENTQIDKKVNAVEIDMEKMFHGIGTNIKPDETKTMDVIEENFITAIKNNDTTAIMNNDETTTDNDTTASKKNNIIATTDTNTTICVSDAAETKNNDTTATKDTIAEFQNPSLSTEQLNSMAQSLDEQHDNLLSEKTKLDRMGASISEQMTKDAQELLRIFGIPYVIAPMEAEAQCAFLEMANLTDGTITDDSDIWLFGGKTVYKNFFNQKKHVVQFLADRIEKSFKLTREQLILLALLVGSDYTTGVSGVGPVTAMEILASFPPKKLTQTDINDQASYTSLVLGLQEFKKWMRSGRRTDESSLRKKLKNISVNDDFPSVRVVHAYMEPNVERSEAKFSWGEPDVTVLRDYSRTKFGWNQNKFDEVINPVLKRMMDRRNQKTMQDYFQRKIQFHTLENQMSKRVKAAVEKLGPEDERTTMEPPDAIPKKRKQSGKNIAEMTETNVEDEMKLAYEDIEAAFRAEGELETAEEYEKTSAYFAAENEKTVCEGVKTAAKNAKRRAKKKLKATVHHIDTETSNINEILHKIEDVPHQQTCEPSTSIDIKVPKLDRYQEIIPQREKDKDSILQNKLKAIEVFRTSKIDKKAVKRKRRTRKAKKIADLSESDSD